MAKGKRPHKPGTIKPPKAEEVATTTAELEQEASPPELVLDEHRRHAAAKPRSDADRMAGGLPTADDEPEPIEGLVVMSSEMRLPFRSASVGHARRHLEVQLDEHQAYILKSLAEGLAPTGPTDRPHVLRNGRTVSHGRTLVSDTVRWLLEEVGRAVGVSPMTTHPAVGRGDKLDLVADGRRR